ncbi:CinA family protein [Calycomorphotria hydatis]|uniref:Nicotinamide-nucleotide amidohydrolase PncC n=1 Tax=Calycomorphotria hydatis TaxID=2528027 RepID=A0A517TC00_9PLAN|nr:nicotinamide-nucleotide amidohydrolase family protein [Calycomorphotria hydatis]QDT65893.1 Nicotinamide-nucleotide amidohydrolase PncC [Calycomorphotria hydatis]
MSSKSERNSKEHWLAIDEAAKMLREALEAKGLNLVLAESCTGGLASAAMTRIPGVSKHFCGSAVVYQEETKGAWLGIGDTVSKYSAVSEETAAAMSAAILEKTPHADLAGAITGYLGPESPENQDGLVFLATQLRSHRAKVIKLEFKTVTSQDPAELRVHRQQEAATRLLSELRTAIAAVIGA